MRPGRRIGAHRLGRHAAGHFEEDLAADRPLRAHVLTLGPDDRVLVLVMHHISADGWSMRVRLDEDKLKQVARATEGEYFRADSANDLKKIYSNAYGAELDH